MINVALSQSNVAIVADQIDFGMMLLATKNPVKQAQAVASYRRLVARALNVTGRLNDDDKAELLKLAQREVANRRHRQFEDVRVKRARIAELKAMREEIEADIAV